MFPLIRHNYLNIHRWTCMTPTRSLPYISYSVHRLVVIDRTAAKSHVSVFVRPSTVSLPVCCVLARFSPSASLAIPLLVHSHRQVPGLAWAISATEGPSCRPAGSETQSWLTRKSTIWAPSREACLPGLGLRKTVVGVEMAAGRVHVGLVEEKGCK